MGRWVVTTIAFVDWETEDAVVAVASVVVGWSAGTVTTTLVELLPHAVHSFVVSVMSKVTVFVAVAGMVLVTCVVLVVRPVGQTSTYVVLTIVVVTSSPLTAAGAETIGTYVVDPVCAGLVTVDCAGIVTITVVGDGPQPLVQAE